MNMNNKTFQCHCEPIALSGAVGDVEAGRSNLLFNAKTDLVKDFRQLRGDCVATAPRRRFGLRPRNDVIKWEGVQ